MGIFALGVTISLEKVTPDFLKKINESCYKTLDIALA